MKESPKEKALIETHQAFIEIGLGARDRSLLSGMMEDGIFGIGTAVDEKIHGIAAVEKLLDHQEEQSRGLAIEWRSEPVFRYAPSDGNNAVFADDVYLTIRAGEEIMDMYLRFSVVLEYADDRWKVIHWHGSKPEQVESEKDTWGVDSWKKKAQELERLVEGKTADLVNKNRELEIESALERVRSRSLSMHKSNELIDVVTVLFAQISELRIPVTAVGIGIYIDGSNDYNAYVCGKLDGQITINQYRLPYVDNRIANDLLEAREKNLELMTGHYTKEEKDSFYAYVIEHSELKRQMPEEIRRFIFESATYTISALLTKHAVIHINDFEGSSISDHDLMILKRFANAFDQAYTRFLDLQKAEAQAREAQVEAALERVRARSLAMHHTDELQDVVNVVAQQLLSMGIDMDGGIFMAINEEVKNDLPCWAAAGSADYMQKVSIPFLDRPIFTRLRDAIRERTPFYTEFYAKSEKDEFLDHMFQHHPWNQNSEARKAELLARDGGYARSVSISHHTAIGVINHHGRAFSDAENAILRRFGAVLEQSYTRFLDLQKAETQAREAQVEAALERVRARTMGMQKSGDLKEVIQVVYEQFVHLGIPTEHAGFIMDYKATDDFNTWIADEFGSPAQVTIPYFDCIYYNRFKQAKEDGIDFFATTLSLEEKNAFYRDLFAHIPGFPEASKDTIFSHPGFTISTVLLENVALYIENFTGVPFSVEEDAILMRFGKVFQQTYSRFLDLQKAEAQAREADIELALERIRSQALAMQESAELLDIVVTMRNEFTRLGHEAGYFWHMMWLPEKYEKAMTSGDGTRIGMVMELPRHIHGNIPLVADWEKGQQPTLVYAMDVDAAVAYVDKMIRLGDFRQVDPQAPTLEDIRHIGGLTFIMARTTHGEIGYSLPGVVEHPPAEDLRMLERFAGAFDLAHQRFLDLKQSEARARDVQIELALERVRARALAMQQPEELREIAQVLRHEMGLLGVEELETSTVFLHDEGSEQAECWFAIRKGSDAEGNLVSDHIALHLPSTWVGRQMADFFASEDIRISIPMRGPDRREWIEYCYAQSSVLDGFYGEHIPDRVYHLYKFSNGAIGAAAPDAISAESWDLLHRTASVFSLAYARFRDLTQARIDLQKLKDEKQRAESALAELRAAQAQLVQAEKMASLGELTAGIAHEIQNPLNFVNNFAEVSQELADELKDEIGRGNVSDAVMVAGDIRENLGKILHHGKRADAIVKGMLQHSRSSSGAKEPTDLNALADEYLRLAYHGLRAKDKSFNASFTADLDPGLPKVDVVPQDIGRVLLNLINNAFYAVSERQRKGDKDYVPTVHVRTSRTGDRVNLVVSDNGSGIPDAIREKIFQPFFTTKPTGQGTGLGLSLAYDIIKAHGGSLTAESREGQGSTFHIELPFSS